MNSSGCSYPQSVKEFHSEDELKCILSQGFSSYADFCNRLSDANEGGQHVVDEPAGIRAPWILPHEHFDAATMEENSIVKESRRLLLLKSYHVLDESNDEDLDRLTGMVSRVFDMPICLITLVDLGRLWFVSNTGLGDLRTIGRQNTICEYAIQQKDNIFIVPDTTKSLIFQNNPIVTGAPHVRFYAGAPLIADGHKIANLCLLDTKPRPEGFTPAQQETLKDFSRMAVRIFENRRFKLHVQTKQERLIAATSHDLMTPLTGLNLALSVIKDDPCFMQKLDDQQAEMIHTASACGDVVSRICIEAMDGLRKGVRTGCPVQPSLHDGHIEDCHNHTTRMPTLRLSGLVDCLDQILCPMRTQVPLIISVDKEVPDEVVCDDLKLLRVALNLLSGAFHRTKSGFVQLRITSNGENSLILECEDTGPNINEQAALDAMLCEDIQLVDDSSLVFMYLASSLVSELGGKMGFKPRADSDHPEEQGSIVWFTIPYVLPTKSISPSPSVSPQPSLFNVRDRCALEMDELEEYDTVSPMGAVHEIVNSRVLAANGLTRQKTALVVDDSIIIRKSLSRALSKLGYEVVVAEDGFHGLQMLKKDLFDVTFMDFLMPNLDGLDCTKQYRDWEQKNRSWARQHIIGISGHASDRDMEKGKNMGMDDFRSKPITLQTIRDILESDVINKVSRDLDELADNEETSSTSDDESKGSKQECIVSSNMRKSLLLPSESLLCPAASFERQCLVIARPQASNCTTEALRVLDDYGWMTETATNSTDALKFLKSRNWGAVVVDDELGPESGTACITHFRQWEKEKRVNAQRNVFLLFPCHTAARNDCRSIIRAPSGFQGVLDTPFSWENLDSLLQANHAQQGKSNVYIVVR